MQISSFKIKSIQQYFNGYEDFLFQPAVVVYPRFSFKQWLTQSVVRVRRTQESHGLVVVREEVMQGVRADAFKAVLSAINSLIGGLDVVQDYGQAIPDFSFQNISVKFINDHIAKNANAERIKSMSRSVNAVKFSTLIKDCYKGDLNKEMAILNRHKIFARIIEYFGLVFKWNPADERVKSICYLGTTIIDSTLYEIKKSGNGSVVNGNLMFAVKENKNEKGHFLLHHYERIIPYYQREEPLVEWNEISVLSVLDKVFKGSDKDKKRILEDLKGLRVFYKNLA